MSSNTLLLQLLLLATFLSLNNFIAALGMGFSKIWTSRYWVIPVVFGFVDFLTPIAGLYIGNFTVGMFGQIMGIVGMLVMFLLGLYLTYDGWIRHSGNEPGTRNDGRHVLADRLIASFGGIIVIALGLSLDNFIVGFGLGTLETPVILVVAVFGLVTFIMASLGVVIGNKIRGQTEEMIRGLDGRGRIITGLVFVAIALWKFVETL